jgi:hypothetical protein
MTTRDYTARILATLALAAALGGGAALADNHAVPQDRRPAATRQLADLQARVATLTRRVKGLEVAADSLRAMANCDLNATRVHDVWISADGGHWVLSADDTNVTTPAEYFVTRDC